MKVLLAILILAALGLGYLKFNPTWWPQHQDQILPYLEKIPGMHALFEREQDQIQLPELPPLADGDPKDTSQVADHPGQGPLVVAPPLNDT